MHQPQNVTQSRLVSVRTMDMLVALLFLGASLVVIIDSLRLGIAWKGSEGPAAGYFPFRIAVVMALASLANLVRALIDAPSGTKTFVTKDGFAKVLLIVVPLLLYVLAIGGLDTPSFSVLGIKVPALQVPALGIYLSSVIYVACFMTFIGGYRADKAIAVGVSMAIALFLLFERKFLVLLPRASWPFDSAEVPIEWAAWAVDVVVVIPAGIALFWLVTAIKIIISSSRDAIRWLLSLL